MSQVLIIGLAFVLMEPVTYAAHRWVMHGIGVRLHRSHHRAVALRRLEANDWFPVIFAAVVMIAFAVGFNLPGWSVLVPIGIGITLYGAAYALVHDGYIHGRIPGISRCNSALLERLAEAHRLHHRFNSEPYGMLFPIVPAELKARAAERPSRALSLSGSQRANGSAPSQVPTEA
jgi:beta-carotene 3-hydroxylase